MCTALHAPLGIEVLRRGIVFIDLATTQVAGVAIVALKIWGMEPSWAGVQVAAFGASAVFAFLFRWVGKTMTVEQEAAIGSCFIVAASVTLLLLANSPHLLKAGFAERRTPIPWLNQRCLSIRFA